MQDKKIVISSLLVAALMLSMTVAPTLAFIYPDGSQDNYFENYGPRMDQILVKKYASLQAEIDALKAGEIDFTDWALEKAMIDDLSTDPNVAIVGYGGEVGYYVLNMNMNPNAYLGNPPDPLYPNPVLDTNPFVVLEFRQATSHLIDRQYLVTGPGNGMYEDIYTPIPAYMTYWIHPDISYTGLLSAYAYPPSISDAAALLDAGGFPLTGSDDGYRYWDKDSDLTEDAGEDMVIDLYSRADALRRGACDILEANWGDPQIMIKFTDTPGGGGVAWQKCMVEKDYHCYSAGWIYIGPDPDYLFDLYHWDNYYHPEDPPNYAAISQYDPAMQTALEGIKFAPDAATAQAAAYEFQELFAATACEVPLCATASPKAYNKWYTGGNDGAILGDAEDKYRGQSWTQVVNMAGQGENNAWTFLNAYPGTYEYGDGNMIARYGWKDNTMPQTLNPMYSSWYWESEIWGKCYDGLGSRDPMTLGPIEVPGIGENATLGTWVDPDTSETLTKVTMTIRSDYKWSDGMPVTIDDVIYTFVDMPRELFDKGCPDVWWQPTLDRIVGFFRLDAYTVEILLDVNTYLGLNWIYGNVVIPKHLWKPYIATHTVAEISGDLSDNPAMLMGSGPFIFVDDTPETVLMVRNPTYTGIFDKPVQLYNQYGLAGTQNKEGIKVVAVSPTTKITPFKVKPSGTPLTADVHIYVPITNLDVNSEQDFMKTIVVTGPGGVVYTYTTLVPIVLAPMAWDIEDFIINDLPPGIYTISVTIEVTSGDVHDWVLANVPAKAAMILGPYTTEKKFWVTVLADLNEDCVVDIFDIVIVGSRFGASFGETLYSPQADVNHDFIIDIFDIVQVALVFGWPG